MNKTQSLKVILYGMGTNFIKSLDYLKLRFILAGCSDKNRDREFLAEKYGMQYIAPEELYLYEFDYILVTSIYGEEIKRDLNILNIENSKILLIEQWQKMEFIHSFGEKNPDKIFYLISKPMRDKNGIISLLNMYLDLLKHIEGKSYIPVIDLQTYKNQYLEDNEVGTVNAWGKFFEPISPYSVDEVLQSKNVILGYDEAGYLSDYEKTYDLLALSKMYKKYIRFKPAVMEVIENEMVRTIKNNDNVIGVLYRGTDMTTLKLAKHMVQPTCEELYEKVKQCKEKWGCKKVFLSTEDINALNYFKEREGDDLLYTNQARYGDIGKNWISDINNNRKNDTFLRGAEYIATIYILSQCDYIVSGVVAGSIGAIIMNEGKYKEKCIINKGTY